MEAFRLGAEALSAERREVQSSGCEYWDSESNFCSLHRPSIQLSEIQDILDYLDTTLHPIISPEYWNVYSELYDMISTLPSAERRGRWIPVTERLPEDEGQYLVSCDTDYGVEVGRFYIDEDGERYFGCDWNDPEDIEAWMPLPEPYKGGAEE